MKFFIIFLFLSLIINLTESTHFRGGIIMFKPESNTGSTNDNIKIAITKRFYWRRESAGLCNGSSLIGEGTILFGSNVSLSSNVYCNEISIIDDWYGGEKIDYLTFNVKSIKSFEGVFQSCCWISTILNGADSGWSVKVKLNLNLRPNTSIINSSPIALIEPIKTLAVNCNHSVKINVADFDGDIVKCRWATLANNECVGNTCGPVSGVLLDGNKCEMLVNLNRIGSYAILIQIEDFLNSASTTPLSSVPLQFLMNVTNSKCIPQNSTIISTDTIKFHETSRPLKEACIGVKPNSLFSEKIVVYSTIKVTEIVVQGPSGIVKSEIKIDPSNSSLYYMTLSWSPTQMQVGYHIFNLKATNQNGLSTTESYSFRIVVGAGAPLLSEPFPNYIVQKLNGYSFKLKSNIPVSKNNQLSYVKIFEKNTNLLVDTIASKDVNVLNQTIAFKSYFSFKLNMQYYVTIDEGLVSSLEYCGVGSTKIDSVSFWNFIVLDPFNGILNYEYLEALGYSNDSIWIDLSNQNINYIKPDTFSGMFQLSYLNLSSNYLNSTNFLQLNNLNTLNELYIDTNNFINLNLNDFTSLKNLTQFSVASNKLDTINYIFNLSNLECIYLNNNHLTQISSNLFDGLYNLKCLYLNDNKLRSIAQGEFSQLTNLNYLNLETNDLIYFDRESFLDLKNLKTVCLRNSPVVDLFPTSFKDICKTSPNCVPKILDWCSE